MESQHGFSIRLSTPDSFNLGIQCFYETDPELGMIHVFSIGFLFFSINFETFVKEEGGN